MMNNRIKELAEQSGFDDIDEHGVYVVDSFIDSRLERFAELVRQDEREACAKAMQPMLRDMISRGQAADIIRARGNT